MTSTDRQCWICHGTDGIDWLAPCQCKGSLQYVHGSCYWDWLSYRYSQLQDPRIHLGNRSHFLQCDICRGPIRVQTYVVHPPIHFTVLLVVVTLFLIVKIPVWVALLAKVGNISLGVNLTLDITNPYVDVGMTLICLVASIILWQYLRHLVSAPTRLGYTATPE
jgi:hypothetical protein